MKRYISPIEQRFWFWVNKNGKIPSHCPELGNCWEWTGHLDIGGRDSIAYSKSSPMKGKRVAAHRLSWEIENGNIPQNLQVLHKCDNSKCVRPSHLFLGTQLENMRDMLLKGRGAIGSKHGQSKLNESEIIQIRTLWTSGNYTQREIGEKFSICQSTISGIVKLKKWKHVHS